MPAVLIGDKVMLNLQFLLGIPAQVMLQPLSWCPLQCSTSYMYLLTLTLCPLRTVSEGFLLYVWELLLLELKSPPRFCFSCKQIQAVLPLG